MGRGRDLVAGSYTHLDVYKRQGIEDMPDQKEDTGTVAEAGPAKLVPIPQEPEEETDADAKVDAEVAPSGDMTDKSDE